MGAASIQQMAQRIAALMEERLRVKGETLAEKLARGGGKLPRDIREQASFLAEGAEQAANPTLFQQLDHTRISQSYDACLRHLKSLDKWERRQAAAVTVLARIAGVVLVVAALAVSFAWWRGLL